ncbi:MAG: PTS sugar transporter subunit IIA, partial [Candidatus Eisenbacteria sp.]|nr:PTS sugar transporter subunit IIA [Candidatus Eisenbacteria bacterium]
DKLFELLQAREAQTSTVVQPGLAIPHVIVEGEKVFDVLLVRCKQGIRFPEVEEPVRVAFVLVGSADERNYHLRALMHVAQITQDPGFDAKWMAAAGPEQLRNMVLLGERRRDVVDRA